MSLQDDYARLLQLADEMPFDLIEEVRSTVTYAGEEAALVLGEGHPGNDRLLGRIGELESTCSQLAHELGGIVDLLRELGQSR